MSAAPPDGGSGSGLTAASADQASEEGAALARTATEVAGQGDGTNVLSTVLSEVPVAVLLIDMADGQVTFANRAAVAMGGHHRLPVPVDEWSAAAGLTDGAGQALSGSGTPLLRIAGGGQASGLTVRVQTEREGSRRLLWATGFPLAELHADRALVILFEVTGNDSPEHASLQRAIVATNIAFTITDPRRHDNPLVWVNPAFEAITGYRSGEVVGQNCRFLQGPATDPATLDILRSTIAAGEAATVVLLNYRKDGTAFWNQLSISPVFDGDGTLVSFVGVQTDVTERVRADADRDRAYAAAQAARDRQSLLAEATGALVSTLEVRDSLARLAQIAVPALADWVVFATVDDNGRADDVVTCHVDGLEDVLAECALRWRAGLGDRSRMRAVVGDGAPIHATRLTEEGLRTILDDPELVTLCAKLGLGSAITVPLVSRHDRILGALTFVARDSTRMWTDVDVEVAADLGRRAGLSVDNARLYQREHAAAVTLQRSLLAPVPDVDGLTIAARYLPADTAADVGGDFYDVLELPDSSYLISVGDVIGHDLTAAAAMGQLRVLLQSLAWERAAHGISADPAEILAVADEVLQSLRITPMATAVVARLDRPATPGGPWTLTTSTAGHPPLIVRHPDGTVSSVASESDVLLGVSRGIDRSAQTETLPAGSLLLGYTDGLIESPGGDIGEALDELRQAVAGYPADVGADGVVDLLAGRVAGSRRDDVALLAICIDC